MNGAGAPDRRADIPHGSAEMAQACAAEAYDLAAGYLAAAAERLQSGDLPGHRCALRCADAALTCGRDIAAMVQIPAP